MGKYDELEKIVDLKNAGYLTEQEFAIEKAKILRNIKKTENKQTVEYEEIEKKGVEPQIKQETIHNNWIWAIIISWVISFFLPYLSILTIVFLIVDMKMLKKYGYDLTKWYYIIIPLYFWKRAILLNEKKTYFWLSIYLPLTLVIISLGVYFFLPVEYKLRDIAEKSIEFFMDESDLEKLSASEIRELNEVKEDIYKKLLREYEQGNLNVDKIDCFYFASDKKEFLECKE